MRIPHIDTYMHACAHACKCTHTHPHTHSRTHTYAHAPAHTCVSVHAHSLTHSLTRLLTRRQLECTHLRARTHTHMHVLCVHVHTRASTSPHGVAGLGAGLRPRRRPLLMGLAPFGCLTLGTGFLAAASCTALAAFCRASLACVGHALGHWMRFCKSKADKCWICN